LNGVPNVFRRTEMEGTKKYSPAFGITQLAESVRGLFDAIPPAIFIFFGVVVETPMIGSMPRSPPGGKPI
jgi:hypothetical protein